jgi:hypothetical protein
MYIMFYRASLFYPKFTLISLHFSLRTGLPIWVKLGMNTATRRQPNVLLSHSPAMDEG